MKFERPLLIRLLVSGQEIAAAALLLFALSTPVNSQNRNVSACLSIANIDERIECLEGRSSVQSTDPIVIQRSNQLRQSSVVPSFDCRAVRTPIERAICSDDLLAEWDAKMGKAFQQAMRLRNYNEALQDNQRQWIAQRNRLCGSGNDITQTCVLEATKNRLALLSELIAREGSDAKASPVQKVEAITTLKTDATSVASDKSVVSSSGTHSNPPSETQSQGDWSFLSIILLALGAWILLKTVSYLQRRRYLIGKHGKEIGLMILSGKMWQGMTEEQLTDSWGKPVEISQEVVRRRVRETWKYGQTGKNRFRNRVYFEDGCVIGWKRA